MKLLKIIISSLTFGLSDEEMGWRSRGFKLEYKEKIQLNMQSEKSAKK